jgi:pimeloyl-ACP methyl ester carboxylesterase
MRRLRHRSAVALAALALVAGAAQPGYAASVQSEDGISIAYEERGAGKTALVFVHGWSCDRSYWSGQLEPFSRQFKVVAVDLAGHGESGLGRKDWSMAAFGADVAAVVRKLDLQQVVLIGHSMGSDVVVEAARRLPKRIVGLVWLDQYKQLDKFYTTEEIQAFEAKFQADFVNTTRSFVRGMFAPASDRALVERIAMDMSSAPPEVAIPALVSTISNGRQIPGALQELKLPVIAINPDKPPTDVESLQRQGVKVMVMPGVGHFVMMEDPERFNGLLRTAIDELARQRQAK